MSTHQFQLTLSAEVRNVRTLVIEGLNCINAIQPTGSGWTLELSELNVGPDRDIDIFAFVEGFPNTTCVLTAQVDDQDAEEFSHVFNRNGNTFFNEAIEV